MADSPWPVRRTPAAAHPRRRMSSTATMKEAFAFARRASICCRASWVGMVVGGDLVPTAPRRSRAKDSRLPPHLDGSPRYLKQTGSNSDRDAGQFVAFVLEKDLGGLLDTVLIQLACDHLMQERNVRDNLFGAFVFTRDGHRTPPATEQYGDKICPVATTPTGQTADVALPAVGPRAAFRLASTADQGWICADQPA